MEERPLFFYQTLENGLMVEVRDLSRRYFGDYHRVVLEVRIRLPLRIELFPEDRDAQSLLAAARTAWGEEVCSPTRLERMGVPGADVESVRRELWDSFVAHGLGYLRHPGYPGRLLRRLLANRKTSRPILKVIS
ncbi:hypothetical protein [Geoalkalibacter sp.]|uniref:hypothetical protein n=1 Tax=Geoalkalibacter sp. TaxID=3041440 RepID=UPI00272DE8BA|nr:hypothetical protein [Geoalkalibacter sp.]